MPSEPIPVESQAALAYLESHMDNVQGWLNPKAARLIVELDGFQKRTGIAGHMCEIGVHHGKFFVLLHLLRRATELSLAIDLFDMQNLNVDASGAGSKEAFLSNLDKYGHGADRLEIMAADSLSLQPAHLKAALLHRGPPVDAFRLFSVDGGHTAIHTAHDLALAEATLAPGGVILIDDYFNRHWPGVAEGVARYFILGTPAIAPFCNCGNKMLFSHVSYHRHYLEWLRTSRAAQKEPLLHGWPVFLIE